MLSIIQANIDRFRALVKSTPESEKLATIKCLLAEEEEKLKALLLKKKHES